MSQQCSYCADQDLCESEFRSDISQVTVTRCNMSSAIAEMATQRCTSPIIAVTRVYLSLTQALSYPRQYHYYHILPKNDSLAYIFTANIMGLTSTTVRELAPKLLTLVK